MTNEKKSCSKNFKSPSTGQLCTGAQYIAELICIRFSEKKNIGTLAYKFWNKAHKTEYQAQIVAANRIIKKYSEQALINVLMANKNIFSLGYYHPHKFVLELTENEYKKLKDKKVEVKEEKKEIELVHVPMKKMKKKSMFSDIKKVEKNNGES